MRGELGRRRDLISVVVHGKKAFPGASTPHQWSFIHSTSVYRVPPTCQALPLDKRGGGGREELQALESMEANEGVCSGRRRAELMPRKPVVDEMSLPAKKGGIDEPRAKVLGGESGEQC